MGHRGIFLSNGKPLAGKSARVRPTLENLEVAWALNGEAKKLGSLGPQCRIVPQASNG